MTTTTPPDDRLDGPVHEFFGLSYSNYQVLHRTLMQSMPVEWQQRMVACLDELHAAFQHIEHPQCFDVTAAVECTYSDLNDADMEALGITCTWTSGDGKTGRYLYHDKNSDEHDEGDRVLVPRPGGDPIPRYNRGRTYIAPKIGNED